MRKHGSIASILKFNEKPQIESVVRLNNTFSGTNAKIGIIGAGNFASATIVPSLLKAKATIKYIASAQGLTAKILAKKAGAECATSDYKVILQDAEVGLVIITTRHNLHAKMVSRASKRVKMYLS